MVESVMAQTYANWELCLADDCSENSAITGMLNEFAASDPRIKLRIRRERGHISRASNSAFEISSGDLIALVDHDDVIEPLALALAADCAGSVPGCDMIYSDEDSILPDGTKGTAYLKPSWSPDLLLSNMYTGHLSFYRRGLFQEAGGFRKGFEGSQDYDLALRASEMADTICHIPQVLYHWRCAPSSTALDLENKRYAFDAGLRALQEAVGRRKGAGRVEHVAGYPGHYRVKYHCAPCQVALMLSGDNTAVKEAVRSIEQELEFNPQWNGRLDFHCFPSKASSFSSPDIFNCPADLFIFLDCDAVKRFGMEQLHELVSLAMRPTSGVVSGMLVDESGMVIHAGIVFDRPGCWRYSHFGFHADDPGYMGRLLDISNCLAVDSSCFAVSSCKLQEAGGMDNRLEKTAVMDLCLKLYAMGFYNVITPHARLTVRQGSVFSEGGCRLEEAFMESWEEFSGRDPFYHPKAMSAIF